MKFEDAQLSKEQLEEYGKQKISMKLVTINRLGKELIRLDVRFPGGDWERIEE